MADDETSKPETATKTRGRKPAATSTATKAAPKAATAKAAAKPAPAKKASPAKKSAPASTRKPATRAKTPAKAKSAPKTATRWPAIAGGAVAAVAAAGAAVFALRKPKAVEGLVDKVQDAVGMGKDATAETKTDTDTAKPTA